jgi:hypothetical protein
MVVDKLLIQLKLANSTNTPKKYCVCYTIIPCILKCSKKLHCPMDAG